MKNYYRTIAIAILVMIGTFTCFVVFSKTNTAEALRQGVEMSLEEDFKIKDSLGKVFFTSTKPVDNDSEVVSVKKPFASDYSSIAEETCVLFEKSNLAAVTASFDGTINVTKEGFSITCGNMTAVYENCTTLLSDGAKVKSGQTVGYCNEELKFTLFIDDKPVNPTEYFE